MQYFTSRVTARQDLDGDYSWIRIEGATPLITFHPGQFAMLHGSWGKDPLLSRAYSILWSKGDSAEFLIRRVGKGSTLLGNTKVGETINVLGPLGNGFPAAEPGITDILVAGGCGIAALFAAAYYRHEASPDQVEVIFGARQKKELVLLDRLTMKGIRVFPITEDGSWGDPGLVTDLLENRLAGRETKVRILACGPEAMLRGVREIARQKNIRCFLSLESVMACGIGACLGCAVLAREQPYFHVCQDGPVFRSEDIWP